MGLENINIGTLKKIMGLRTSLMDLPMFDMRNKLEMIAVKTGLKLCFLFSRNVCESRKELTSLKKLATLLGLKQRTTINPPLYCSRTPRVNPNFLKAWYNQAQFEALWVYQDSLVEKQIDKCLNGNLNEGYLLGYPECCINWHKENRTLEVESEFQDIENFIAQYPSVLDYCQIENEEELYSQVLSMTYPKEEHEKVWAAISRQIIETYRHYPYAPHWACSACLEGKSEETDLLNAKYEKLSSKINSQFHIDFFNSVEQAVREYEESNH